MSGWGDACNWALEYNSTQTNHVIAMMTTAFDPNASSAMTTRHLIAPEISAFSCG
jgi:hypothetical protein